MTEQATTPPSETPLLIQERPGPHMALLHLNRPDKYNALSSGLVRALVAALEDCQREKMRCVILTGHGRAFAAGADIAELERCDAVAAAVYIQSLQGLCRRIEHFPVPVIAAINGLAMGGGFEVALACDWLVAEEQARFALPEIKLGVIPGAGGTQRLPRLIGRNRAKEMIFLGEAITAQQALAMGVVNRVVPVGQAVATAVALAEQLAKQAPVALQAAKRVINQGLEQPLGTALELEASALAVLFGTPDQQEGMAAFVAKRKPRFTGEQG